MSKYQLITDLCESKVFRSRQATTKFSKSQKENLLYGTLLGTIALSLDTTTAAWAKEYASKTAAFSNFDHFRPSATDLYVLLHMANLGQETSRMVQLLKKIGRGAATQADIQQALLRLERKLGSIEPRLKTARRTVVSWGSTSPASRKSAVQNMLLVIRSISRRSEVLPYLKVLKGGPKGSFGKSSTLKKAAALAGIGLAGLALGYKSYDPSKRFGFGKRRESVELGGEGMLAEDRATQLAYIAQKLPDHPAVEKVISVNYLSDGISAFVRTKDGNAYEFEIRPARFAKGHEEKRGVTESEPKCQECNDTGWTQEKHYDDVVKAPCQYCDAERSVTEGAETTPCEWCNASGVDEWSETCFSCGGKGETYLDGGYVDDDDLWEYKVVEIDDFDE